MQLEIGVVDMRVLIDVVHPLGIEQRGPAFDAVHFIAFGEQKFRQIRAILARDASNQSFFHLFISIYVSQLDRNIAFIIHRQLVELPVLDEVFHTFQMLP